MQDQQDSEGEAGRLTSGVPEHKESLSLLRLKASSGKQIGVMHYLSLLQQATTTQVTDLSTVLLHDTECLKKQPLPREKGILATILAVAVGKIIG